MRVSVKLSIRCQREERVRTHSWYRCSQYCRKGVLESWYTEIEISVYQHNWQIVAKLMTCVQMLNFSDQAFAPSLILQDPDESAEWSNSKNRENGKSRHEVRVWWVSSVYALCNRQGEKSTCVFTHDISSTARKNTSWNLDKTPKEIQNYKLDYSNMIFAIIEHP